MGEIRYTRAYIDRASLREDGEGPITFVLATEGRKHDGLDLQMSGVDLSRFERNPVLPWAHDYRQPPIGKWSNVHPDGPRLLGDATFDRDDEFAAGVERKYRAGYLNAVSVGFNPRVILDEDGNMAKGFFPEGKVTEWELMEASAVPIPMDADALVASGRSATRALAHDVLDALGEEGWKALLAARAGAVLSGRNRSRIEQARDLLGEVLAEAKDAGETEQQNLDGAETRLRDLLEAIPA